MQRSISEQDGHELAEQALHGEGAGRGEGAGQFRQRLSIGRTEAKQAMLGELRARVQAILDRPAGSWSASRPAGEADRVRPVSPLFKVGADAGDADAGDAGSETEFAECSRPAASRFPGARSVAHRSGEAEAPSRSRVVAASPAKACSAAAGSAAAGVAKGAWGLSIPWTFGIDEIDAVLPAGGLRGDDLHEIKPSQPRDIPAAMGFAMALLLRRRSIAQALHHKRRSQGRDDRTEILWAWTEQQAREFGRPCELGMRGFGIVPDLLLLVELARNKDLLWVLEEGLRSGALAGVVGVLPGLELTASRRLLLAARSGGMPCLALTSHNMAASVAAATRWRISSARSASGPFDPQAPGRPCWKIELDRCRNGLAGSDTAEKSSDEKSLAGKSGAGKSEAGKSWAGKYWIVEWCHETFRFHLSAAMADRAASPCAGTIAGWVPGRDGRRAGRAG